MMPSLKLFLLGPPRLERDGRSLTFDTRKNIALVAYLALTAQCHSRETLVTLLWPELDPRRARAVLRRNLSVLRKTLGGEWLVVNGSDVGTDPGADFELDVDRFRCLLAACQAHDHPDTQVCPRCLGTLAQAVELYRGDLLEGFGLRDSAAFDEWQFFQAESLRQAFAAALQKLVRGYSARREFHAAIRYARRWLSLDPLHEPAHRSLMRLYAQAGQRAAALRQYQACARLLEQELALSPAQETTDLYQQIRAQPSWASRHNLPAQSTPFIGRTQLLNEIAARIADPDCRLLTLVGPGGSGKTRLSIEAARNVLPSAQLGRYPDGVFFASLVSLRSTEAIVPTVAQALGLTLHTTGRGTATETRQQLLDYVRHKRLLLVLDNLEHLLARAANNEQPPRQADDQSARNAPQDRKGTVSLLADLLDAAPGICILATSRIRLNVQGEQLLPIPGMDYPEVLPHAWPDTAPPPQQAAAHSAIALFLSAARRVQPDYELTQDNLAGIIRICHLVAGMPLGILLAASWVQVLSAAEIADQIAARLPGRGLDFLQTDLRDVPERHRSMRAVFDHSWTLLTERERSAMQELSVFCGGFAREAGHQVTRVSLPELRTLVNKSLIHVQPSGRYHIHELVRQYAALRLAQSPPASEMAHRRHCTFYLSALWQWALDLKGPRQQDILAEIDVEIDNVHAAWEWAVEHTQLPQLTLALDGLCFYYQRRGRLEEGQKACLSVIEKTKDTVPSDLAAPDAKARRRLLAKALTWQGVFTRLMGHVGQAGSILERSIALLETLDPIDRNAQAERAFALLEVGWQALDLDRDRAKRCAEQSLDLYRALDDRWGVADALYMLGLLTDGLGNYDRARHVLSESLSIRQALGDRQGTASAFALLGLVSLRVGQLDRGETLIRQSVILLRDLGDRVGLADGLHYLGFAAFLQGRFEDGIVCQEECLAIADDLALGHQRGMALQALGTYHTMLGQYEPARAHATAGLAHARALGDIYVIGAACTVLGGVSLAQTKYTDAQRWFESGLAAFQEIGQQDGQSWSLAYQGYAAQGMGDLDRARHYLWDALHIGIETNAFLSITITLSGIALLVAHLGELELALELWALLSRYPWISNAQFSQDTVGQHLAVAAADLPSAAAVAARERGMTRDLNATAAEMLFRLGNR